MKENSMDVYKKILSPKEIEAIPDKELKEIRSKYWKLRHDAFLNDDETSDNDLDKVISALFDEEAKAIKEYREKKGDI